MLVDFIRNLFLLLQRHTVCEYGAVFQKRFLCVGCLTMNELRERNQLVPGLAMGPAVLACINRGQLPFLFSRQRLYSLDQPLRQAFRLLLCSKRRSWLPEVGTEIQIFQPKPVSFANHGLEFFWFEKQLRLRQRTG